MKIEKCKLENVLIIHLDKFVNDTGWQPTIGFDDTMLSLLDYWGKRVNDSNETL
jgi:hypothetical protein